MDLSAWSTQVEYFTKFTQIDQTQVEYSFGKILNLSGPGGQVICFVYDVFCWRSVFNEVND